MIRVDTGGVVAGLVFAVMGIAFVFEAEGVWDFRLSHLAVLGPLVLILAGVAVLLRAVTVQRS